MSLIQNGSIAASNGTLSGLLLELVEATTTWDEGWGEKWNYALSRAYLDIGDEAAALGAIESKPEPDREAAVQADEVDFPYFAVLARRHLAQSLLMQDAANTEAPALLESVIADAQRYGFADALREANQLALSTS